MKEIKFKIDHLYKIEHDDNIKWFTVSLFLGYNEDKKQVNFKEIIYVRNGIEVPPTNYTVDRNFYKQDPFTITELGYRDNYPEYFL